MDVSSVMELVSINEHSSIRVGAPKGSRESFVLPTLYFDPYQIRASVKDADIVFITHDHYDHYSPESLACVAHSGTHFVVPSSLSEAIFALGYSRAQIHVLRPGETALVRGISVQTMPSYNTDKSFHPKENDWLGYCVDYSGVKVLVAGDTDATEHLAAALPQSDIALIPVGGTYTMDARQAAQLVNEVAQGPHHPDFVIPTHYGTVAGSPDDGRSFVALLRDTWRARLLL